MQRGCGRLYLTGNLHLTSNLDVVIVVVGVRSDPEAAFLQSCREIIPFICAILKQTYRRQHITEGSRNGPVQNVHRFIGTRSVLIISRQLSCRDIKQNFNRNSKFTFYTHANQQRQSRRFVVRTKKIVFVLIDSDRRIQAVAHAHMQRKRETPNKNTSVSNPIWFPNSKHRTERKTKS